MEQIQAIINEANLAGMTELERMDANNTQQNGKISTVGTEGESQFKQALLDAEFALEQQHQTKRLDLVLGTGTKIQEMTKAFQQKQLQGAIAFLPLILVDYHSIAVNCLS